MTPAAEYNVYVDPHAAAIVFGAGLPIVMMGLNLTHQAICSHDEVERIGQFGTATGRAIHGMLTRPRAVRLGTSGHPMHDPCVIAYVLWPELFEGHDCFVEVETSAGPLRGRTTIDWNGRLQRTPNALVMDKVDASNMFRRMIDLIATLP
jgi:purine nucleosidase